MSRLDDIERRLAALESGGGNDSMEPRLKALEDCLGITSTSSGLSAPECPMIHCDRCNADQKVGATFRCPQTKCPLK